MYVFSYTDLQNGVIDIEEYNNRRFIRNMMELQEIPLSTIKQNSDNSSKNVKTANNG